MSGTQQSPGILPRAIECIFSSIGDQKAKRYVRIPGYAFCTLHFCLGISFNTYGAKCLVD